MLRHSIKIKRINDKKYKINNDNFSFKIIYRMEK